MSNIIDSEKLEQRKIIQELRDKLLNEKLSRLQCAIERVEELSSKTYEQSLITNGRVNKIEHDRPIERIKTLEDKIFSIESIYKYRKQIMFVGIILYIILASSIFSSEIVEFIFK